MVNVVHPVLLVRLLSVIAFATWVKLFCVIAHNQIVFLPRMGRQRGCFVRINLTCIVTVRPLHKQIIFFHCG